MTTEVSSVTPLGVDGFTFADLHQPARLRDLYQRFTEQVKAAEPELWAQWLQYREVPESLSPIARGNIVVAMAPHVSRFVSALFNVGAEAAELAAATRVYDELFRFKVDFVRRRALPLLKGGAHVTATAEDHALVDAIFHSLLLHDHEMALSHYGCSLLDREAAAKSASDTEAAAKVAAEIESLKRWCAAHIHDPRYRGWVVFRFPENLDYDHSSRCSGPIRRCPKRWPAQPIASAAARDSQT